MAHLEDAREKESPPNSGKVHTTKRKKAKLAYELDKINETKLN